ncbi:MAG: RNA 2',3'-cyclic phosphodiesterase [Candidatus Omnitrophica bacterium]|nr:RNA 2',3'-cyclic phosphodiesterase [Candidatus Omnitrophota bacterium]
MVINMSTIRAFIAIEINNQTKQKISKLISILKKSNADAKWATEDKLHLTLKFLGNVHKDKIQEIANVISIISNNFKSFAVSFSEIGAFPNTSCPQVIWLGIDKGTESLKMLNDKIEASLEKLGFAKESRKFEPHLTLARIRSSKNISNLKKLIGEISCNIGNEIPISKLILFQSNLNPKGAVYSILLEKFLQDINGKKD